MVGTTVPELFARMPDRLVPAEYNYEHFTRKHLLQDARWTAAGRGIKPGKPAPDFELENTEGGRVRLSDFGDDIVLLRFGSYT
jgi:hypothetical protein